MRELAILGVLLLAPIALAAPEPDGWHYLAVDIARGGSWTLQWSYVASHAHGFGWSSHSTVGSRDAVVIPGMPSEQREFELWATFEADNSIPTTRLELVYWHAGIFDLRTSTRSGAASLVDSSSGIGGAYLVTGAGWGGVQQPLLNGDADASVGLETSIAVNHTLFGTFTDPWMEIDDVCVEFYCLHNLDEPRVLTTRGPGSVSIGTEYFFGDAPPGRYTFRADGASTTTATPVLAVADLDLPWE